MMNNRSLVKKFYFLFAFMLIFSLSSFYAPVQALTLRENLVLMQSDASKISPQVQHAINSSVEDELRSVIITLKAQANLSNILDRNRKTRIRRVETALQNMADATQSRIRTLIETRQSEGKVAAVEYYWIFNGLALTATANVIEEIAALPEVRSVTPNSSIQAPAGRKSLSFAESNLNVIGVGELWQMGFQGQGIVVANMDTGVYLNHPDLSTKWRGGTNSWFDPNGEHISTPTDYNGHGTWTMGVMVGGDAGGTTVGVAPGAQWIAVKIFNDQGSAAVAGIHAGYQWLLDPDGNPATDDAPHVVNNSWTYQSPGCDLEFELDLEALSTAGIVPVFAAGNYGPYGGTSVSPSNNPFAFAVGGTDNNDFIYTSSSRGPSSCGEAQTTYPELVAPGVDIHTTDLYGFYTNATGTSLAAPHVAGGLALLLNAFPNLLASEQESALINSAVDLGVAGPDNDFGFGRLDLLAAYQLLLNNPTSDPLNLALNQPVTVSSYQDNSHDGSKAVDGDSTSYWQSKQIKGKGGGPSSEWITVDLGGNASINKIVLEWDSYYATNYAIRVSEDASSWTTVFTTSSENGGNDTIDVNVASVRYVRMESTAWNDAKLRNWLNEFEVYGTASSTPTPTPSPTPSPTQTPPPSGGTVHIGDLDGSGNLGSRGRWDASVVINVHDDNENLVNGATVTGSWNTGGSGSCVTDNQGQCSLIKSNLKGSQSSITFTIDGISYLSYTYQPDVNHDPDGESNGTYIMIFQP